MTTTAPTYTNFLYRFEAGAATHTFTAVSANQTYNSETYLPRGISHTSPTFGTNPQAAEIDVDASEALELAELFISGPPPYPIKLTIYEYDRVAQTATPYWRGWVVRSSFSLTASKLSLHCKTVWLYFERESFTDSLSSLSRYSIYDPRVGVDMESFRVGVTVTALNDQRDVLTVTGITDIDDYYTGGFIISPDRHVRTILKHETVAGNKRLTLNGAFPLFSLAVGFTADIYPGDDLLYATWANKFATQSNHGEAWGGWQYTPNVDPAVRGVI